jgi:hypothetical protein
VKKRRKRPVWRRSVRVEKGVGHTAYGRADFVGLLFMRGFSIRELCEGLADGCVPAEVVEDAIRFYLRSPHAKEKETKR